jgi:hypothetical protein
MNRQDIILTILDLNIEANKVFKKMFNSWSDPDSKLTKSWYELKPERFYLVESTSHREEEFTTSIEVRYRLRSQEAAAYGRDHQVFYDRYLSTTSVELQYLENPQGFIDLLNKERAERDN